MRIQREAGKEAIERGRKLRKEPGPWAPLRPGSSTALGTDILCSMPIPALSLGPLDTRYRTLTRAARQSRASTKCRIKSQVANSQNSLPARCLQLPALASRAVWIERSPERRSTCHARYLIVET